MYVGNNILGEIYLKVSVISNAAARQTIMIIFQINVISILHCFQVGWLGD